MPRLPSRKTGAILTAAMLALGTATGALIGPGPAASLASGARAAALGRVLTLLALGSATSSGSEPLLSSGATSTPTSGAQPTSSSTHEASGTGAETSGGGSGAASRSSHHASSSAGTHSASSPSPTSSTAPAAKGEEGGEGESEKPKTPLPPIADVWVIEIPYGGSLENALKQSAAAPYLDGQLKAQGTLLNTYTPLEAGQLAGAAALLSGQVGASVTTVAPPACASAPGAAAATGQPSTAAQGTTGAPCPVGEPAGVQAANAFLQEALPAILASAPYREHGLVAIAFTASASEASGSTVTYPSGTVTSTLTSGGTPTGVLLLSPFLRHPGTASTSAFNPLVPRESLAGLLTTPHR
jgi:hypothetical protein